MKAGSMPSDPARTAAARVVLDALPANAALVDADAKIIVVNEGWRRFAAANGYRGDACALGENYLAVCERAGGDSGDEAPDVAAGLRAVLCGEADSFSIEYPCHSPGERRWFRAIMMPVANDVGAGALVLHFNVTERKAAEERLDHALQLLRIAGRTARVGGWIMDLADNRITWSEEVCAIHGMPIGTNPTRGEALRFFTPRWRGAISAAVGACMLEGVPFDEQMQIRTAQGSELWVRICGEAVRGADGRVTGIHGALQDIQRHVVAEQQSERLAARLTTTLESISDAFYLLDRQWRFAFVNGQAERVLQRSRVDLIGRVVWEAFPETVETELHRHFVLAMDEGTATEFVFFYPPLAVWFDVRAYPSEEGLAVYFRDVSAKRAADEKLRESEARFRAIARATADAVWDWNLVEGMVGWNDGVQPVFGHDPRQLEPGPESWTNRIHPEDRARVEAGIHTAIERRDEYWEDEYRFVAADGAHVDVADRGYLIVDAAGKPLRMVGGMRDITERKRAQAKLEQQAALLDEAQDAIIVLGVDRRVQYWNRSAERLYGWRADAVLGQCFETLTRADDGSAYRAALAVVVEAGAWRGRLLQRREDGSVVTMEGKWTQVCDARGEPVAILAIHTDITERLALEEQLQQAQRLEAIGQLTGGVAHDFNNLLQVILGNAEALVAALDDDAKLRLLAEMTRTAAERGAELTGRLLAFARRQALEPTATDVVRLVAGMDSLLRRTLGEDIELEIVRGGGLWLALVDPGQLENAILNLCLNARDAMPEGGRLTIELANAYLDQSYAERHNEVAPGQYFMVAVSDTGVGMSPDVAARVFEPFFSTKAVGKGSGLGLSMVFGFVKQSGGHMKIYTEPGQGTTVKLYLPRVWDGRPAEPRLSSEPVDAVGDGEKILVVEDDELVREHVAAQLRSLGYRVVSVGDGREALDMLRQVADFDLLFTDVVMPGGMTGRQLADAARQLRPGLPVLFTSGYTENAIVHHGRLDPGVLLLNKPYRRKDLAAKVRLALAQGESRA